MKTVEKRPLNIIVPTKLIATLDKLNKPKGPDKVRAFAPSRTALIVSILEGWIADQKAKG